MSFPLTAETVPTLALNCHPVGAFKISVTPFCGVAKSVFAPSVRTMFGSVVYDGDVAFAAVSALMLALPGVTATFANDAVAATMTAMMAKILDNFTADLFLQMR